MIILAGLYFIPPSPRWLLYKGRRDEAIAVLESVRPKRDVAAGLCVEEANAIEESIREEAELRKSGTAEKLGWLDLFKGPNLRRTTIATLGWSESLEFFICHWIMMLNSSICIPATYWYEQVFVTEILVDSRFPGQGFSSQYGTYVLFGPFIAQETLI